MGGHRRPLEDEGYFAGLQITHLARLVGDPIRCLEIRDPPLQGVILHIESGDLALGVGKLALLCAGLAIRPDGLRDQAEHRQPEGADGQGQQEQPGPQAQDAPGPPARLAPSFGSRWNLLRASCSGL